MPKYGQALESTASGHLKLKREILTCVPAFIPISIFTTAQQMHNLYHHFRKWRHVLVLALLVLVVVHLRTAQNFPFNAGYTFPWRDFLVSFAGSLFLWELQFWNIRRIYKKGLFEHGFSISLVWKVLALNLGSTILFYLCYVPFVTVVIYRQPLSFYSLSVGLILSLAMALVINGVYLSLELYAYWQEGLHKPALQPGVSVSEKPKHSSVLLLQAGKEQVQVPLNQLAYFYSENKIVFAVFTSGRRMATNYTLNEVESLLPPRDFFKVSRQVIAHRQAIHSVKKDTNFKLLLTLQAQGHLARTETVSRYKAAEFKEWFNTAAV